MILASHGIIGSQIIVAPVATAATGVGQTSFTANWNAYTGAVVYLLDVSTSPTFDTFIYENQEVNAPTTSYVVIGIQSNTTYYYRVRASTEALTDPDALAFFARVEDASGTLSATEKAAVNQLVLDMKFDGIWNSMKAIYPMVGASAAACAQNLKSSSFTGVFTATGWTFASTGVKPNGTAHMNTFLAPSVHLSQNDAHASIYSRTNNTSGTQIDLGCGYTGLNENFYLSAHYEGIGAISNINGSGFALGSINTTSLGFFLSQRTSSSNTNIYQNNNLIKTHGQGSTTPTTVTINLGRNTTTENSLRELAFASFGSSFDVTKRGNFNTAVQNFQIALSREV